jgi:hypothetical protein
MKYRRDFHYLTNCVSCGDGEAIQDMTDSAQEITWDTLIRHVSVDEVQEVFPQYSYRGEMYNLKTGELTTGFSMKKDWAVSFWKSIFRGERCYYISHSGIEYIFLQGEK